MSAERNLLAAAISSRDAYELMRRNLSEEEFTETGRVIMGEIDGYYSRDAEATKVVPETLRGLLLQSVTNPKHKETFERVMDGLSGTEVSGLNVVHEVIQSKRAALGQKIAAQLAADNTDGLDEMMEQYRTLSSQTDLDSSTREGFEILVGAKVQDMVGDNPTEGLIRLFPKALNDRLDGGVRRGHHVVVFARPEAGKTTFLVNLMYGFVRQGLKCLYIGNEEPVEDIVLRCKGRLTGLTKYEILHDPQTADALSEEKGFLQLAFTHMTPGSPRDIENAVRTVKPDVLIVDQLRNIQTGGKADNITQNLEKAAVAVRQIGGRNDCLVVSVTQAGDSASGKAVLEMNDVDSSNTGIPAQADLMIGIGYSREDESAGRRVLSLPKNKLGGDHGFFPVGVDFTTFRITSME